MSHRYTNAVMCACDHMGDVSVADARMDITTSSYGRPLVAQLQRRLLLLVSSGSSRTCHSVNRYQKSTAGLMVACILQVVLGVIYMIFVCSMAAAVSHGARRKHVYTERVPHTKYVYLSPLS